MLKALELTGFKSFADKTRFEFHEGVTVVVGPNGSGKSNVVDAIKWVLGSQSAKSLRGGEMTDVIFNGSGSRGALNAAEATLVLDNREGLYGHTSLLAGRNSQMGPEVAITRRVYRSGEGEYLINGAACRLRDIRELLAGTGIGTEAYSIIEQGKVDALLQASPRDRRAIFEEAAGISRFRGKRQEAARRLARVEQNLLRLSDIVDEVESRLRSVRMQAGKAQRYRDGVRRLKALRTEIGVADWRALADRLQRITGELSQFQSEHTGRREWIAAAEAELPRLDRDLQSCQTACEQFDQQLAALRERMVACQAQAVGLAARRDDFAANGGRLEHEWRAAASNHPTEETPDELVAARLAAARKQYDETSRALAASVEREHQLATAVEHGRSQLAELERRYAELTSRRQLVAQQLSRLSEERARRDEQLVKQQGEERHLAAELSQLTAQLADARTAEQRAAARGEESERRLTTTQALIARHEREVADVQRTRQQVESELLSKQHRIELMSELDRELHDMQNQVREFIAGKLGGPAATVADLLHVDVDTAPLIEAALGSLAEYFVVSSTARVLHQTDGLPPGAKLLRLDCRQPASAVDRVDLTEQPGVWGRADQFVESDAEYAPLVKRLLGRTWLVDTLATAVRLASTAGLGLHFVTADGDLLTADGALVAGRRKQSPSALTRRSQIEQLHAEIAKLAPQAETLRQQHAQLQQAAEAARSHAATALDDHRSALEKLSEARQQVAHLAGRQGLLADRHATLSGTNHEAAASRAELEQNLTQAHQAHELLQTQDQQLAAACEKIKIQLTHAEGQWREARELRQRQELAAAKLEQQIEILAAAAAVRQSSPSEREVRAELANRLDQLHSRISEVDRERLACTAELSILAWRREQLAPQRAQAAAGRVQLKKRRELVERQLTQARRQVDDTQERRAKLELAASRLEHQRQTLVERLRDDYEIDLPVVAAAAPEELPPIDRQQVEREINELREGLHRIGSVNVDALEELDAIESRFEAISAQYNDLSQAKTSLERLMTRLNTESRELFLSTVETVRGHFQELFRRLFGGGSADIILEDYDSDDALECGVEIRACPPGKDTRTISLLSGGEKTMTCVALLLAMFRSKPSPFCVLDEVDAALDEANVGRFVGVLSDFLSSTQFVVITHSKKTMTGADTLYGVTMQESGVSKQVSVRFDDVTDDGFIKLGDGRKDAGEQPLQRAA